ncbi:MAG TPA: SDR family oxidoreductase [Hyphomonadaceae bacterium]|nr:SDR family oxidoreductase [Hyphomonadaceae bacterium]HPI47425.1 SDR family oxidoreductase [Hyphomonadaceae bacterium]
MRVFVTGAAGFIGSGVVPDLIAAGHTVTGLARSDANVETLKRMGADVLHGSLEDIDSLKRGVTEADGVIHLAFIHDFAKFAENGQIDKRAIEAMGETLAGTNKPLVVTSGVGLLTPGRLSTEEDAAREGAALPRVSEHAAFAFASRGVRVSAVRLPQVHGADGKAGFVGYLHQIAKAKGVSAYIGDGSNRWAAAHRADVAPVYRLAMEKGEAGARYHAVSDERVRIRDIAEIIGRQLNIPVVSIKPEQAPEHFGWLAAFAAGDAPSSSALTQQRLGWKPTQLGLIADISRPGYFG